MNSCINEVFAEFIVTVQHSASGRFVSRHQHRQWPCLWCCQIVCQPHFVGLNTTTNALLWNWRICWIYCTCHCTALCIGKICSSASASATPIVLLNTMPTPFCMPEYYNKWILIWLHPTPNKLLSILCCSISSIWYTAVLMPCLRLTPMPIPFADADPHIL